MGEFIGCVFAIIFGLLIAFVTNGLFDKMDVAFKERTVKECINYSKITNIPTKLVGEECYGQLGNIWLPTYKIRGVVNADNAP